MLARFDRRDLKSSSKEWPGRLPRTGTEIERSMPGTEKTATSQRVPQLSWIRRPGLSVTGSVTVEMGGIGCGHGSSSSPGRRSYPALAALLEHDVLVTAIAQFGISTILPRSHRLVAAAATVAFCPRDASTTTSLVGELQLFIRPLMLGFGKRLFGHAPLPRTLHLANTGTTNTGTMSAVYVLDRWWKVMRANLDECRTTTRQLTLATADTEQHKGMMKMGEYRGIRDASLWVEERGEGDAVLLLHGGMSDVDEFDSNLFLLADRFRVIGYDRRGFGRSADTGPFTMEAMTDDAAAVIESVAGGPAHLVGYSAGGMVAALVAVRRPDLVSSLTIISSALQADDWIVRPQAPADHSADAGYPAVIVDRYAQLSPDGREHFPVLVRKAAELATHDAASADALTSYPGRALIVTADDDFVTLESQIALYRSLRHGELAVIPGTSHMLLLEKPYQVTTLVRDFLENAPRVTLAPIGRAGL